MRGAHSAPCPKQRGGAQELTPFARCQDAERRLREMRVPVGARRRPLQPLDETGAPEEAEPPRWPASGGMLVAGGTPAIPTIGGLLAAATAGR